MRIDLETLRQSLPASPLTRFAPSPTGHLHLGHAANAVWVWGLARALRGRVLLRLEDHDRGRCRPTYEASILRDLAWLGLEPDLGLPAEFARGPSAHRQSDCNAAYEQALARLAAVHRVYACACSRREVALDAGGTSGREAPYRGRCRRLNLEPVPGRGLRLVIDPGPERFRDALLGEQVQEPARQCGDLLLRDRLGNWTYQFAVTADDCGDGVDLVIRGVDLLASTGRQIRLARLLGRRTPPLFLHHPLILKPSGHKLSKASGDTGIADLRAAGWSAEEVLGEAAFRVGLLARAAPVSAAGIEDLFG